MRRCRGTAKPAFVFLRTGLELHAPGARLSGATIVRLSALGLQRDPHRSVK
jgi:hypothetical protein